MVRDVADPAEQPAVREHGHGQIDVQKVRPARDVGVVPDEDVAVPDLVGRELT
jgi:hypothetical protein